MPPADATTAPTARGRVRVDVSPKRVRVYLGGEIVADSRRVTLVYEVPYYPQYYFPREDVRTDRLVPTESTDHSPSRGDARFFTVTSSRGDAVDGAWQYPASPIEELRDLIRFDWSAMDSWFEEDEEVFGHPRNPATRVEVLESSRHVEVRVDGVLVADTRHPRILLETGLPPRYYLPAVDVRMELLEPTATESQCPYKGTARYWSVRIGDELVPDLAWSYPTPLPESIKVAGLICFYNEKA
ncbi:MAG: DUF427 domain-containing protein, partial [Acidimicrobiia bacterium]